MRTTTLILFLGISFIGFGQEVDENPELKDVKNLITTSYELLQKQQFDASLDSITKAKYITIKESGKNNRLYAQCLRIEGAIYFYQRKPNEALPMFEEVYTIYKEILPPQDENFIMGLSNLAALYDLLSDFDKAESLYLEGIKLINDFDQPIGKGAAALYNNLSVLYKKTGQYEKAEKSLLKALELNMLLDGKETHAYAGSLLNLATTYKDMGLYSKAEPFYLESIAINGKVGGENHPDYTGSLDGIATFYTYIGNYQKAKLYYEKVLSNYQKTLGKESHDYARTLSNLTQANFSLNGVFADTLLLESVNIIRRNFPKNSFEYAFSSSKLGFYYLHLEDYEKAKKYYGEYVELMRDSLKADKIKYTSGEEGVAICLKNLNQYDQAEKMYLDILDNRENRFGKNSLTYGHCLKNLEALYFESQQFQKSEYLLYDQFNNLSARLNSSFSFMSEAEKEKFIHAKISPFSNLIHSRAHYIKSDSFQNIQYDLALLLKGVQLHSKKATFNYIAKLKDSTATDLYYKLLGTRRLLAKQYESMHVNNSSTDEIIALEEKLEKQLARISFDFRNAQANSKIHRGDISNFLKPKEAAIEFIMFDDVNSKQANKKSYVAILQLHNNQNAIFIPLFEEKQFTNLLSGNSQKGYIELAYNARGLKPKRKNDSADGLYELIWKPIEKHLEGVEQVYYSPSGLLHRINFDAIPIDKKKSLVDQYQLTRLGSTRSLVVSDFTNESSANDAVLYGGINYQGDEVLAARGVADSTSLSRSNTELSFTYTDRSIPSRGDSWNYLVGTQEEVTKISTSLKQSGFVPLTYSGSSATEETFKMIGSEKPSPRILHIATHGFFFPDPKNDNQSRLNDQEPIFKISDHPMIRSGLILAGGNHAWKTGDSLRPDMEDGILTAYEISQMDLSHTELVVLSACETGLGDIEGNEGVYGLQRAFKIAGAKYLIMSLWQVPDNQTQELMTTFYSKWLTEKMSIPDAFRQSQKEMREKYDDPYFWAGFVLVE